MEDHILDLDFIGDLIEILDGLCDALAKQAPADAALQDIAARAHDLYRESIGEI